MGASERKARELQKRKQLILQKSKELFFARGFDGVTVADVCREAEYGKSALYALFPSKEDLYAHVCLESLEILARLMEEVRPGAADVGREFITCAELFFGFFKEHPSHYKALFYFSTGRGISRIIAAQTQAELDAAEAKALSPLAAVVDQAVKRGICRPVDPAHAAFLFWASLMGIISAFICKDQEDQTETIRSCCMDHARLYLRGLSI